MNAQSPSIAAWGNAATLRQFLAYVTFGVVYYLLAAYAVSLPFPAKLPVLIWPGHGLALGVLPLLFYVVPELGTIAILGLRLPWLVLGILVYPFLCGLGWWFTRTAERIEQDFANHIQDN